MFAVPPPTALTVPSSSTSATSSSSETHVTAASSTSLPSFAVTTAFNETLLCPLAVLRIATDGSTEIDATSGSDGSADSPGSDEASGPADSPGISDAIGPSDAPGSAVGSTDVSGPAVTSGPADSPGLSDAIGPSVAPGVSNPGAVVGSVLPPPGFPDCNGGTAGACVGGSVGFAAAFIDLDVTLQVSFTVLIAHLPFGTYLIVPVIVEVPFFFAVSLTDISFCLLRATIFFLLVFHFVATIIFTLFFFTFNVNAFFPALS